MILDYTLINILKEIQAEIKKEHEVELSLDVIEGIIDQQTKSTIEAMKCGHTVSWKYFGKFVATQGRIKWVNKVLERMGKEPTLVDRGYMRFSFNRKGDQTSESTFTPASKKDLDHTLNTKSNGEDTEIKTKIS